MVYNFFDYRTGLGASVNEKLPPKLHKSVAKKTNERKCMQRLKIIFGRQIYLKWDHYFLRIESTNIYCV